MHQLVPRPVPTLVADTVTDEADEPGESAGPADDDAVVIPEARSTTPAPSADDEQADASAPARPARAPRRAKVPRWDDIMFGMKPKDGS